MEENKVAEVFLWKRLAVKTRKHQAKSGNNASVTRTEPESTFFLAHHHHVGGSPAVFTSSTSPKYTKQTSKLLTR